jgi:hypothetical protein
MLNVHMPQTQSRDRSLRVKIHLIAAALLPATLLAVAHAPAPAQTNPVALADCEPICLRQPYQVDKTGKFFFYQWMTVSKPGPSLAGKVQNRFLDAAAVRIYRGANERLTLADIGTVGLFRGTNNGWFATGHRGNYERFLGPDTPIGPDQPVICLREDWLDLKAGDLVIVDRLAETADGRIRQGLGKAGKDLLPWKTEGNVRADLVLHDARALAEADDWSTHGQGCLRIRNDEPRKAGYAQQVLRRDTRPVEMVFRARLVDASEPLDLTCTFAGKNIATVKLENRWRPIRISLPAGRSGHQGLGFALPPRAQLEVDDFRPAGPRRRSS